MSFFIPNEHTLVAFSLGPVGVMGVPQTVTATAAAGEGDLAIATYKYKVTGVNDTGQTAGSTEATVTTTALGGVTVAWAALDGASSYRIYGRDTSEKLITQVGNVTSWLDTGALAVGTITPPTIGNASNLNAPTVADVNEAVDLTRFVTGCNFSATGNTVPTPNLKSLFEPNIEGTSQATSTLDGYRDDEIDTLWTLLPRRTRGYVFISRLTATPGVGDPIEVWPVRVSSRAGGAMTSNTPVPCTITFAVPAEPAEDAVIAA